MGIMGIIGIMPRPKLLIEAFPLPDPTIPRPEPDCELDPTDDPVWRAYLL
ncbi:hypothetical protein CgS9114_09321 [Corynebacterium glutamicum S9114]|nr:hypothetical protein CgS9114_09321 [Corynebacterium glutamicum S9114]